MSKSNIAVIRGYSKNIFGESLQLEAGSTRDLEVLDLGGCENLTSKGLENILGYAARDKLKELDIGWTQVSLEELSSVITTFSNLEVICLKGCRFTDVELISFLNVAGGNLKKMDISCTCITLSEMSLLTTTFSRMEELIMGDSDDITEAGVISFLNKTGDNLKKLDLANTNIDFSEIELLTNSFSKLEELDLAECHCITDVGLINFLNKAGNLKKLDLSHTSIALSEVGLLTTFSRLEEVDMSSCHNITDVGLITFLNKTGSNLQKLNISYNDIMLSEVGSLTTLPGLEELNVSVCRQMTDKGLISFLNKAGNLKKMDLSDTNIALPEVGLLTTTFPKLEDLDVSGCRNITDGGFCALLSTIGRGLTLNLNATNISEENVKAQFPMIKIQIYSTM